MSIEFSKILAYINLAIAIRANYHAVLYSDRAIGRDSAVKDKEDSCVQ